MIGEALRALWGPRVKAGRQAAITAVPYVVVDTELTGLDGRCDSIISIGALRMVGGRIDLGESFYRLVKPRSDFKAESVVIHEITPSEVGGKPAIDEVLGEFLRFCDEDVVVGYCLAIDLEFLNREMRRLYRRRLRNPALDVYSLFECLKRRLPSHPVLSSLGGEARLYDIAAAFGVPVNGAHNASMDAYITAQVFQRFLPLLREAGFERIGDLLRAGNPSRGGDAFRSSKEVCNL